MSKKQQTQRARRSGASRTASDPQTTVFVQTRTRNTRTGKGQAVVPRRGRGTRFTTTDDWQRITVSRRELWQTIDAPGSYRFSFRSSDYPIWFGTIANLYETVELHKVRLIAMPSYSKLSSGLLTISFNNNPTDLQPESVAAMLQQQGARQVQLTKSTTLEIPPDVFRGTPTRRYTYGPGSYFFDCDINVQASTKEPISIIIEYKATFHTPQARTNTARVINVSRSAVDGTTITTGSPTGIVLAGTTEAIAGIPLRPGEWCSIDGYLSANNTIAVADNRGNILAAAAVAHNDQTLSNELSAPGFYATVRGLFKAADQASLLWTGQPIVSLLYENVSNAIRWIIPRIADKRVTTGAATAIGWPAQAGTALLEAWTAPAPVTTKFEGIENVEEAFDHTEPQSEAFAID
uniref:Coat protein n=1 Tax=Statovirus E1 TaxID=1964824 RepID=A0A1U9WUJ4_9VIRU|nr:coat protein [Statovirus E1]